MLRRNEYRSTSADALADNISQIINNACDELKSKGLMISEQFRCTSPAADVANSHINISDIHTKWDKANLIDIECLSPHYDDQLIEQSPYGKLFIQNSSNLPTLQSNNSGIYVMKFNGEYIIIGTISNKALSLSTLDSLTIHTSSRIHYDTANNSCMVFICCNGVDADDIFEQLNELIYMKNTKYSPMCTFEQYCFCTFTGVNYTNLSKMKVVSNDTLTVKYNKDMCILSNHCNNNTITIHSDGVIEKKVDQTSRIIYSKLQMRYHNGRYFVSLYNGPIFNEFKTFKKLIKWLTKKYRWETWKAGVVDSALRKTLAMSMYSLLN